MGGIWWSKKHDYKNAIANELFLSVAASLANRAKDEGKKKGLTSWADKEWTWFAASGMINSHGLINDGLDSSNPAACVNNNQTTWTYNQGVLLGGLTELAHLEQDPTMLTAATATAKAAFAALVTPQGILQESNVSGADGPQFKGIFVRNLLKLDTAGRDAVFEEFFIRNAQSILAHDNRSGRLGALWEGPFDLNDASRQSSAIDCLNAYLAVSQMAALETPGAAEAKSSHGKH